MPGKHAPIECPICKKMMRSDNLPKHSKTHAKSDDGDAVIYTGIHKTFPRKKAARAPPPPNVLQWNTPDGEFGGFIETVPPRFEWETPAVVTANDDPGGYTAAIVAAIYRTTDFYGRPPPT